MIPKEKENNAYAKFGATNKEYYGIFRSGLFIASTQLQIFKEALNPLHIMSYNCAESFILASFFISEIIKIISAIKNEGLITVRF